jgi:hypothetical protein
MAIIIIPIMFWIMSMIPARIPEIDHENQHGRTKKLYISDFPLMNFVTNFLLIGKAFFYNPVFFSSRSFGKVFKWIYEILTS